jgi:hypothetical protein
MVRDKCEQVQGNIGTNCGVFDYLTMVCCSSQHNGSGMGKVFEGPKSKLTKRNIFIIVMHAGNFY